MKIKDVQQNYSEALDPTRNKTIARPKDEAPELVKADNKAFNVQLSTAAERLNTPAPEDDEARRQKVDAIREQLSSGTYNISGKDVANKILNALKG